MKESGIEAIEVTDNGSGIDEGNYDTLGNQFFRANRTKSGSPHTYQHSSTTHQSCPSLTT